MTLRKSTQLKKLQTSLSRAKDEGDYGAVEQIKSKIDKLTNGNGEPIVSEHALLRYLHRVKGIDLRQMENEILNGRRKFIASMPEGCIKLNSGHKIYFRNNVVTTIVKPQKRRTK